jgi:uncharacterized lipoprotein YajG
MLKKLIGLLLISGLASSLLLSACGSQPDDAQPNTATQNSISQNNSQASTPSSSSSPSNPANTAQTSLLASLAQLYPSGQVPEAQKMQLAKAVNLASTPIVPLRSAGIEPLQM